MPKLLHIRDGVVVKEYELGQASLRIGREMDNDICLVESTVSGYHTVLTSKPSPYMEGLNDIFVDDLGSTNGTLLNGNPIQHQRLRHNDIINIGTHEFRFIDDSKQPLDSTRIYVSETNS